MSENYLVLKEAHKIFQRLLFLLKHWMKQVDGIKCGLFMKNMNVAKLLQKKKKRRLATILSIFPVIHINNNYKSAGKNYQKMQKA